MMSVELFGHLGFIFVALSFAVRDILWLRCLAIGASVSLAVYNYVGPSEPLWLVIGWQAVFLLINVLQIGYHLRQRRDATLDSDLAALITSTMAVPVVAKR